MIDVNPLKAMVESGGDLPEDTVWGFRSDNPSRQQHEMAKCAREKIIQRCVPSTDDVEEQIEQIVEWQSRIFVSRRRRITASRKRIGIHAEEAIPLTIPNVAIISYIRVLNQDMQVRVIQSGSHEVSKMQMKKEAALRTARTRMGKTDVAMLALKLPSQSAGSNVGKSMFESYACNSESTLSVATEETAGL